MPRMPRISTKEAIRVFDIEFVSTIHYEAAILT
jgi:hypothetical protein